MYLKIIGVLVLFGAGSLAYQSSSAALSAPERNDTTSPSSTPPRVVMIATTSTPLPEMVTTVLSPDQISEPTADDILTTDTDRTTNTDVVTLPNEAETPDSAPATRTDSTVYTVPFYSQFTDISKPSWRKVGCGIASLAMLINFYEPKVVSTDTLLDAGIAANAFLPDAGWTHQGLINLSTKYGLTGSTKSFAGASMETAFEGLKTALSEGPVMVSVHYTFEPTNPIPHLVVVNGVEDGLVYYNDPAESAGGHTISITKFQNAWKKRYIAIRPTTT